MSSPWSFKIQQVTLVAATALAITPPVSARSVEILNTTGDDVTVYDNDNAAAQSLTITAGFAKDIDTHVQGFVPGIVAFYLKSAIGGTAVLIWS
jgi:hypothetical protein